MRRATHVLNIRRGWALAILLGTLPGTGCTSLVTRTAGKPVSTALADAQDTRLGHHFLELAKAHADLSGFHLIQTGVDGLTARVQIARSAERTLDLQYFIFRGDETGA